MAAEKSNQEVLDGLMRDLKRAGELGLIPQDGARISARGEFIVEPSNIEDDENKKMRRYRFQEFPKHLHGWGVDPANPDAGEGPLFVEVKNRDEEAAAVAAGWSVDPLHGPRGLLSALAEDDEVDALAQVDGPKEPVKQFTAPGATARRASTPKAAKAEKKPKAEKTPKGDSAPDA